jgi:hypothetical protein
MNAMEDQLGKEACTCNGWKENIEHLNAGFTLMLVHGGVGYTGKVIEFCPWCGKKLKERSPQEESKFTNLPPIVSPSSVYKVPFKTYTNVGFETEDRGKK